MKHEEPDQIPFDLAGTTWTGIINGAYQQLLARVNFDPGKPDWADLIQHIVTILFTNESPCYRITQKDMNKPGGSINLKY
jgi:hypothetical protein